jgi:hypothetical protein
MSYSPYPEITAQHAAPAGRTDEERSVIVSDENDKKPLGQGADGAYEPPKVIRVSLRPEEAVLGHCKVTGAMGPVGSSSCRSFISCRTLGS